MKKEKDEFPFEWIEKRIKSKKPIRNEKGSMLYSDALKYLIRVIPQDSPSFDFILTLASFASCKKLSDKQAEKASEIIRFYEKEGVL